jgi:hypothetical protein
MIWCFCCERPNIEQRQAHNRIGSTLSATSRMGSWSPSGAVFPPQQTPGILDHAPRNRLKASDCVVLRVRPGQHNPHSIATIRIVIARYLSDCHLDVPAWIVLGIVFCVNIRLDYAIRGS